MEFYPMQRHYLNQEEEMEKVWQRAFDIAKGARMGMMFAFMNKDDGNLEVYALPMEVADREKSFETMHRTMNKPNFRCWFLSDEGMVIFEQMQLVITSVPHPAIL
jgi:hypothetical protein